MLEGDVSSVKRLSQTKISTYFTGCIKSLPVEKELSPKRKRRSNTRRKLSFATSMSSEKTETPNRAKKVISIDISPEECNLSLVANIPKRKLPAPIFSDDENSDTENHSQGDCKKDKHSPKQPKLFISVNKHTLDVSCTKTYVKWTPSLASAPENNNLDVTTPCAKTNPNQGKSTNSVQEETPSCSKNESDDVNNDKTTPKQIRVIENIVVQSPKRSPQKSLQKDESINQIKKENIVLQSPKKSPQKSPEKNEKINQIKKVNYEQLKVMREFFINVSNNSCLLTLLNKSDREFLFDFYNIERDYQYVCIKLFLWKPLWYNIFDFVQKIHLPMDDSKITVMYTFLNEKGFVDCDYMGEDLFTLLNVLSLKDVRDIGRSFKLSTVSGTKDFIISKLIKTCSTQATLSILNTEDILKKRIKEKMGFCVKLSPRLNKCLYTIYLLNTFTNSSLVDPQDYFKNVTYFNVVFPKYEIENYHIFYTPQEFLRYADAVKLKSELQQALENRNNVHVFEICRCAFNMVKELNNNNAVDPSREPHLERFTPTAKYISIISSGSKHITSHYFNEVQVWLEYLIAQDYCKHKRADWYCQLILIYTHYIKNYEKAAKLLIKAFKGEKDNFSDIQGQELADRGRLLNKKTYKLPVLYHDEIAALSPPLCERTWPQDVLDCKSVQSEELGKKRVYVSRCANGDVNYLTVEQTALEYYKDLGFPNGEHCEGRLIHAAFCLLFFDIIYATYVKGTFVSSIQNAPLDMYSEHFYTNREGPIKKRLKAISGKWTDEVLKKSIFTNWDRHSHESSLCQIDSHVQGPQYLFDILMCIGRPVLSKIFERLVKNFRIYHSGFPDLLLWNLEEKKAKFVEVKSENDKLSIKQKLWLNYLIDVGAAVAVCHVEPKSSKKKINFTKK